MRLLKIIKAAIAAMIEYPIQDRILDYFVQRDPEHYEMFRIRNNQQNIITRITNGTDGLLIRVKPGNWETC